MNGADREACLKDLAERMGLEEIPSPVAGEIPENVLEQAHAVDDEESWEDLEAVTRPLLNVFHRGRGATVGSGRGRERREAPEEITVVLDPHTRQHGEVLAELAAARLDVRMFRRRYLRDRLLSDNEADSFLRTDRISRKRNAAQRALRRLGEDLERAYGWRARRARRFVLTGRAPDPIHVAVATSGVQPDPVAISAEGASEHLTPPKARISVEADAWVDADEVARAFRAAQHQLLGSSPRKRPERTLEAVRFVARQIREHGKRPSWKDLRTHWNREHPEWQYTYRQGLRETFERFVHPKKGIRRPKWRRDPG